MARRFRIPFLTEPPTSLGQRSMTTQKKSGGFLEVAKTVIVAVLIAIGIRTFAYEPFNIPSGSMKPTLLIGDYLFVAKWSYGYSRYSLPLGLDLFGGRIFASSPQRGDVAVFKLPRDPKVDYIKRIIGLPGDQIQVKEGILYINGQAVQRQKIADYVDEPSGLRLNQYIETLPNGVQHRILELSDTAPLDTTDVYVVPPGHYFGMGDNRDNSLDSRVPVTSEGVGFIPAENLVGRAEFIFFSMSGDSEFWQLWKWPVAIRWDRLFHSAQR